MLKPFLPQLQMTFTKALNDASRPVRLRAADALGQQVTIHTRVDPLFTELLKAARDADDTSVRFSHNNNNNIPALTADTYLNPLR